MVAKLSDFDDKLNVEVLALNLWVTRTYGS